MVPAPPNDDQDVDDVHQFISTDSREQHRSRPPTHRIMSKLEIDQSLRCSITKGVSETFQENGEAVGRHDNEQCKESATRSVQVHTRTIQEEQDGRENNVISVECRESSEGISDHIIGAATTTSTNLLTTAQDVAVEEDDDDDMSMTFDQQSATSMSSIDDHLLADYPRFHRTEVRLGKVLGKGSFGIVREVTSFAIEEEPKISAYGGYRSRHNLFANVEEESAPDLHISPEVRKSTRRASFANSVQSIDIDGLIEEEPTNTSSKGGSRRASLNSKNPKRNSMLSSTTFQSSCRSAAFGIEGRTFLSRHCIRTDKEELVTRQKILTRLGLPPNLPPNQENEANENRIQRIFSPGQAGKYKSTRRGQGDCRYAVKHLRDEVLSDPELREMALIDIHTETRILAHVEHPNIVKMRAFAFESSDAEYAGYDAETGNNFNPKGYFIVMDRLYDTLDQRIETWAEKLKKAKRITGLLRRNRIQRDVWEQRLVAAYDIACALDYLHSMGIAYRDLKPQNVAFDIRGDCKLYDFGLSKELNLEDIRENGTYEPSSIVGALRYMPPEVARGEPYNHSVDTFSFAILLWEILRLAKPYGEMGLGPTGHRRQVIDGGLRPPLHETWSEPLCSMMETGWSADINKRPPMSSVIGTLKWELASVRDDMAEGLLNHDRRRSTFVMMKKKKRK